MVFPSGGAAWFFPSGGAVWFSHQVGQRGFPIRWSGVVFPSGGAVRFSHQVGQRGFPIRWGGAVSLLLRALCTPQVGGLGEGPRGSWASWQNVKKCKNVTKVCFFAGKCGFCEYLCIWKRASAQNGRQMAANSPESFRIAMKALSKKAVL